MNTLWFLKNVPEYIRMENQDYKNENIEKKYEEKKRKNQFIRVENSLLELEKHFTELEDIELKDKKEKIIKKEIE